MTADTPRTAEHPAAQYECSAETAAHAADAPRPPPAPHTADAVATPRTPTASEVAGHVGRHVAPGERQLE